MGQAILALTDGTAAGRLNLLNEGGLSVVEWRPRRSGVNASFREAPGLDGRLPSSWKFDPATETLEHNARAQTADDLIELFQDMYRLLIQGLNYHTVNWQNKMVWLECKAEYETNTRYALVTLFQPGDDDFPFRDPFLPIGGIKPSSTNTGLIIERGHWCALPPGTGECVEISNLFEWDYTGSDDLVELGAEASCDGILHLANKYSDLNLTHIKRFDASGNSYTNIFPITSFPQALFPTPPAVGDILYLGYELDRFEVDAVIPNVVPSSFVFDIGTPLSGNPTIVWEYYNAGLGDWDGLDTQDNTDNFTNTGIGSVFWQVPTWSFISVNGVGGFWARARITALTGTVSPPTQVNRQIYEAVKPYFEIQEEGIGGDIPSLARFRLTNRSDGGSELHSNRVICGLRSTGRGENFVAFLNATDTSSIDVSLGADTAFQTKIGTATGRMARYQPATTDPDLASRVIFTFIDNVQNFYGTFHAFLRVYQTSGDPGDISIRLKVITGSGGSPFYSRAVSPKVAGDWEVIDLDAITLGGNVNPDELCDQTSIEVQLANLAAGSVFVHIYDLFLAPADELFGDFTDQANTENSPIGLFNDTQHLIDIDSITNPRKTGRSVVRDTDDKISSVYEFATNGEVILQANATQRLWVFSMSYGDNDGWIARPEVGWSVQAYKNQRYLAARGSR